MNKDDEESLRTLRRFATAQSAAAQAHVAKRCEGAAGAGRSQAPGLRDPAAKGRTWETRLQSWYAESFTREMGCTEAEFVQWLVPAVGDRPLTVGERHAEAPIESGRLALDWTVLPPRRIALISMPRLEVRFDFAGVSEAGRQAFMKRFDVYMQRGGG